MTSKKSKKKIHEFRIHECEFCEKKVQSEKKLEKHVSKCKIKKRVDITRSRKGRLALNYYNYWMGLSGRKSVSRNSFVHSSYLTSMIKFVNFCKKKSLPDVKHYIEYLHKNNILPNLWSNDMFYENYLIKFDELCSPERQAEITIETLFTLADIFECEVCEIFDNIMPVHVAKLLYARKLSMWVLAFSQKFRDYYNFTPNSEERVLIKNVMYSDKYKKLFIKHPEKVKKMRSYVKELRL